MRPLIVAIHGILTSQTRADWPDEFDAWCERDGVNAHVIKKEYAAGPFPIWNTLVKNPRLARGLAAEIELFCDAEYARVGGNNPALHFVAHSNGTDVALKTVKLLAARGIPTTTLILVGSIVEPDLDKNGIAELLHEGDLQRAIAYVSERDSAIGIESFFPWCAYKNLGRVGWKLAGNTLAPTLGAADFVIDHEVNGGKVITRRFDRYDHGTYFEGALRAQTFALFRKDCGL